jgi:cytochrome c biogenesis protein CcmG/thiol:disulfide interchange protein DsbE
MSNETVDSIDLSPPVDATSKNHFIRAMFLVPLTVFGGLLLALGWGLTSDPQNIPSPLVGKKVPSFELPAVKGRTLGLSNTDLMGTVSLVNVFASWCTACELEHPFLMDLAATGTVPIHGLNYKDRPDDAAAWLNKRGDPYTRTGADVSGRVGIDWGVYGVPETFVIGPEGHIAYKHVGPLTPETIQNTIIPLVQSLSTK